MYLSRETAKHFTHTLIDNHFFEFTFPIYRDPASFLHSLVRSYSSCPFFDFPLFNFLSYICVGYGCCSHLARVLSVPHLYQCHFLQLLSHIDDPGLYLLSRSLYLSRAHSFHLLSIY